MKKKNKNNKKKQNPDDSNWDGNTNDIQYAIKSKDNINFNPILKINKKNKNK